MGSTVQARLEQLFRAVDIDSSGEVDKSELFQLRQTRFVALLAPVPIEICECCQANNWADNRGAPTIVRPTSSREGLVAGSLATSARTTFWAD